jgi:hypothetical protein
MTEDSYLHTVRTLHLTEHFLLVSHSDLFNDAVSTTDYIVSNDRMVKK